MNKIRNSVLAGALVLSGGVAAGVGMSQPAAHASGSVYSTSNRVETLISGTCYYETQTTRTYFSWSSKLGHYKPLAAPRTTTTTSTHCHS
jgi:hypothetical protein